MSAITETTATVLAVTRAREHPHCFVCSPDDPQGLRMHFDVLADGSTQGQFDCDKEFEGFPGIIHGGVLSALVDCAMLHCLFAKGESGLTVDLSIQFRHPVEVGVPAMVCAEILEQGHSLYRLAARVLQQGQVKVKATARFLGKREPRSSIPEDNGNGHDHNHC
jgi:acyl-coenzyme A thioesterase PaaI-like protein